MFIYHDIFGLHARERSVIIHGAPSNFPNKRKNIREGFVV
jgi:hypothetical protein